MLTNPEKVGEFLSKEDSGNFIKNCDNGTLYLDNSALQWYVKMNNKWVKIEDPMQPVSLCKNCSK